jgi:hypothetical protein
VTEQAKAANETEDIRPYAPVTYLEYQGRAEGFDCYRIPSPLKLRPDSYNSVRLFLEGLVSHFTARLGCSHESFIQTSQLREQANTRLFAGNARKWIPETGLGVWPHRPAPRMWKIEDMEDMNPNSGMPTLLHSMFRVTADGNARLDAMSTMAGTGGGLQLVSYVEGSVLLRNLKELFLGFIQDRVFRIFPWYVPLFEKAGFADPMERLAVNAMRDISLYIRESAEDGGILIVSAQPLAEIFARIGCEQVEDAPIPKWKLGG